MAYVTDRDFAAFKILYDAKITGLSKQLEIVRRLVTERTGPRAADLTAISVSLNEKITNLAKQINILSAKI